MDSHIAIRSGNAPETVTFERIYSERGKLGTIHVSADCTGEFQTCNESPETDAELEKFKLQNYNGGYPLVVTSIGSGRSHADRGAEISRSNTTDYLISKDGEVLRAESPLVIHGICAFSVTYTTFEETESSRDPFLLKQIVPSYCPKIVRAASPIPVHLHELYKDMGTIYQMVHILTGEQYIALSQTLESKPYPRNVLHAERKANSLKDLRDIERESSSLSTPSSPSTQR